MAIVFEFSEQHRNTSTLIGLVVVPSRLYFFRKFTVRVIRLKLVIESL